MARATIRKPNLKEIATPMFSFQARDPMIASLTNLEPSCLSLMHLVQAGQNARRKCRRTTARQYFSLSIAQTKAAAQGISRVRFAHRGTRPAAAIRGRIKPSVVDIVMRKQTILTFILCIAASVATKAEDAFKPSPSMGFFITSVGSGKGGDLGGLAGADAHCQALAAAVGAGNRMWRAYLSTSAIGNSKAVNAHDRIGLGPWANAKGMLVARNIEELHEIIKTVQELHRNYNTGPMDQNNINATSALTEKGEAISSTDSSLGRRNSFTGSMPNGRAYKVGGHLTCGQWKKGISGSWQHAPSMT